VLEIKVDKQFKKDLKRDQKSGKFSPEAFEVLKSVMDALIEAKEPDAQHFPHRLIGEWKGYSECHIRPNWLLIYKQTDTCINFARLGTHQQLFKNF
jgi:mRNA interferase YafQ